MKKLILLFTIGLFATLTFGQDFYLGSAAPENYISPDENPIVLDGDRSLPCLACSIPEGEADIQDNEEDVVNGGCNINPPLFIDVNPGDVYCGRTNTYNNGSSRDTDWYRLILTETKTMYLTGSGDCDLNLFILSTDDNCNASVVANVTAPAGVDSQTSYVCTPGTWYFWVGSPTFSGVDNGADYQIVITEGPPTDPWCASEIPVSNWAIYLSIFLMLIFSAFYFRRRLA